MSTRVWPAWAAWAVLTGIGVWALVDHTQLPGASPIGRICLAIMLSAMGLSLVIADTRAAWDAERRRNQ